MKTYLFYILFLVSCGSVFAQENDALFNKATQDYANENYEAAIRKYKKILKDDDVSAALYYNLGNAEYKLNHIAPSIFYYEKALQLAPNDADIQNNLAFAQNMRIDAIDELPKTGLSKIIDGLISKLSFNGWAWLAIMASVFFTISIILYYFAHISWRKRLYFGFAIIFLLVGIVGVSFAYAQQNIQQSKKYAIIFAEEGSVKSGPNRTQDQVFLLHEGTKVKVLDAFNGFLKIELSDGRQGWITKKDLKQL